MSHSVSPATVHALIVSYSAVRDLRKHLQTIGKHAKQNAKHVGWFVLAGPNPDEMKGIDVLSYVSV